jgi:hypothetical protein
MKPSVHARVELSMLLLALLVVMVPGTRVEAQCAPIPGAFDQFPSTGKVILVLDPPLGTGVPEVIRVGSSGLPDTVVQRAPEGPPGMIQTELLQLELSGNGALIGPIRVHENAGRPSPGRIENVQKAPFPVCTFEQGDSFFDVFVLVDLPNLGMQVYNEDAFRVYRRIRTLPPRDEDYENPFILAVNLYDVANPFPVGPPVGKLLYELHEADPELPPQDTDCFETGLQNMIQIFDPYIPGGYGPAPLFSQGPTQVRRNDPYDPGTGLDTIDTEILQLDLRGVDLGLGNFRIQTNPSTTSQGQGVESPSPSATYPVDSFFDVFVHINTDNVGLLKTQPPNPTHIEATNPLRTVPPGVQEQYGEPPAAPMTPLWDAAGSTQVGWIWDVRHTIGEYRSWQPPPGEGPDCFDSWLTLDIEIFDPYIPGGCVERVMLSGPFKILRGNPFDPGDGHDTILTRMACLEATGAGVCLGSLRAKLSRTLNSDGTIRSLAPAENFPADSFFDVFFEIETSSVGRVHNEPPDAGSMRTSINAVPPDDGEIYYGPGTVIPLYNDAGIIVGQIIEVAHEIHSDIFCGNICVPEIRFPRKDQVSLGGGRGAGVTDLHQTDLSTLKMTGGNFGSGICVSDDGPSLVSYPQTPTATGKAFALIAREDSPMTSPGTYNSGAPSQVGNRDATATACP